jgi:hypothetical protein
MLTIFKLRNGKEKVSGKIKKWENSKGPAWEKNKQTNKKTEANLKNEIKEEKIKPKEMNHIHIYIYQSINFLSIYLSINCQLSISIPFITYVSSIN